MSEADVLYVEDLAYRYGKTEVFAGASLSLRAGEVAFLTGPNGAGKSTLLRCLAGWDAPAEGRVELCGRRFDGADRAQRSLLAFVPDVPSFYDDLTAGEHIRFVRQANRMSADDDPSERLMALFGLDGHRDQLPSAYSRGMRQKLALVLAFILTKKIRGRDFFRSVFFMPSMLSVAVIGVVFTYLFNHNQGVVNSVIRLLGGEGVKWFSGGTSAMIMLMIASIWQNFGINMLFFMTGLQAIPPEMYEAASIDGASNTRQFLTITIPLLGPVLQMVLMNAILGSLKVTDLVLTLTNGKPSGKTEVMMTYIYKKFFGDGGASGLDFGYGAALTVVTAVILGIVTLIYLRATKKSGDVY